MIQYNFKKKDLDDESMQSVRRSQRKSETTMKSSKNETVNTSMYSQIPCNVIIWGKWKQQYKEPILLNIEGEEDKQPAPLQCHFYDMRAGQDFCFFITESGELYVMGASKTGMLGLGLNETDTKGLAKRVKIGKDEDHEIVKDIKIGKNHILVLTNYGKVYAWGNNTRGQVGCPPVSTKGKNQEENQSKKDTEKEKEKIKQKLTPRELEELKTIWDPRLVYPTEDHQDILSLQSQYDEAVQIEAFDDTSFLLTEEGYLFSWGFSDNGFLGREPTLDLKQFFESKNNKNLPFSNQIPVKVQKLEKFVIQRIKIENGKFFAFLIDEIIEPVQVTDLNSNKDTEEEKDKVPHRVPQTGRNGDTTKGGSFVNELNKNHDFTTLSQAHKTRGESQDRKNNHDQSKGSKSIEIYSSQQHEGTGLLQKGKSNIFQQNRNNKTFFQQNLKIALQIKEDMVKFDRALAENIKPLADFQLGNIYEQVIDKFSLGNVNINHADALAEVIQRMQIQLKKNFGELEKFEDKIEKLQLEIQKKQIQANQQLKGSGDNELFKDLYGLLELLNDSLTLKKFNLVGCKMKVYQERMREINFLEMINHFKEDNDFLNIENYSGLLLICKNNCIKIQKSLKKNQSRYVQLHKNMTIPSSLAMSALTNAVYQTCDVWNGMNDLSCLTHILQTKMQEVEYTNEEVRELLKLFEILEKTDFNKKVIQYKDKQLQYETTKDWFDAMIREIQIDINDVIHRARSSIKAARGNNDILHGFQTIVLDSALIRQLLYSAQQALFENAQKQNNEEKQVKGLTTKCSTNGGRTKKAPSDNSSFETDSVL